MSEQDDVRSEGEYIQLTRSQVAVVDVNVADRVKRHKWYAQRDRSGPYYAIRAVTTDTGKKGKQLLHRFIWESIHGPIPEKMQIDHIDGNTLNNHLDNLRLVTNRQNCQNKAVHRNGLTSSRFPGVNWFQRDRNWRAELRKNGRKHYLGSFATEEEAYNAYCRAVADLGDTPLAAYVPVFTEQAGERA